MSKRSMEGKIIRKFGGLAFVSSKCEFFLPIDMGKALWTHRDMIGKDVSIDIPEIYPEPTKSLDEVMLVCEGVARYFHSSQVTLQAPDGMVIYRPHTD